MYWILLLILLVPATEIAIFIWIGGMTGSLFIITLIVFTGIVGISLAKQQGIETLNRARLAVNIGQVPGREIMDGICILVGAVLLIIPGFITDAVGFILLFPWSRNLVTNQLQKLLKRMINKRTITFRRW